MPRGRVLVVDDNELQREVVADALLGEGYEVAAAASGAEAVAAALETPPDVLILDLLLPDTDGATILGRLRAEPTLVGMRVLVATGVHSSSLRRLLGVEGVLFKPFGLRELLSAIDAALEPTAAAPSTPPA